jgi:hypothetical protein
MRTGAFLYALLLAASASVTSSQECGTDTLGHDKVEAFVQPTPLTDAEKAAVRLNPTISISAGCFPYPAVNKLGQLGRGLKPTGKDNGKCKGSRHGSQVYGRAIKYKTKWLFAYAYYVPKIHAGAVLARHDWNAAIIWINHLNETEKIAGLVTMNHRVELSQRSKFESYVMDGDRVKLVLGGPHLTLGVSSRNGGETLPLIMWEQLSNEARNALNCTKWGTDYKMPLADDVFHALVEKVWAMIE